MENIYTYEPKEISSTTNKDKLLNTIGDLTEHE